MRRLLAAALALTALMWLPTATPPQIADAASVCTGWTSVRVPPTTIRVLRSSGASSGYVEVVPFKKYVQIVLAAEWPPTWLAAALQTGAVAVKQYGWYYSMHWRGGTAHAACYDVSDNNNDQIYQPESRTPSAAQLSAIEATWTKSVTKNGSFVMMGYRSGASVACGADRDGYHLYQHSSLACARAGMTVDQILHVYFDSGVAIWTPPATPSGVIFSPAVQAQVTVGSSATLAWAEQPAAGTTVASRVVSLLMALPRNGSCAVDRWVTASPAWQATAASPQTVTGLRSGLCYRAVVALSSSDGITTEWQSGTMMVDPAAPQATFTSPLPNVVTATTGTTATVRWTETVATGTHIVSRSLVTERAAQAAAGTCAGAQWATLTSTTSASPVSSAGLGKLFCYRYRLVLTDSAGHKSTTISADLIGPSA
jgi:hypothetical protein